MKKELYDYDIFPKVFPVGRKVDITVRGLGEHVRFRGEYRIVVQRLNSGSTRQEFTAWNHTDFCVSAAPDNILRFSYTADTECEHFVRIEQDGKRLVQLSVYALEADLACRLPFRGDLHMHTCRSDGHEDPATVCANYRKIGYDFIVVTDHHRYYPSLEARRAYAGAPITLNILPGEEVHLPLTDVHIVNAGGTFSVNGLLETSWQYREKGGDPSARSLDGAAPPMVPMETYERQVKTLGQAAGCPEDVDPVSYGVCCWAFQKIREAGGLGIFAHPYWIADMWHVPEPFTRFMLKEHPFDAFEVLGGESYYEQNGFQTALYYDEYREGRVHPIVGSTDSHNSTEHNRNGAVCSTIVFAHENERTDLLASIRDRYSVAVDTISKEYRLVGEFRLQKYACFLMENWFPIHDRVAAMDGELMREYYLGEADASELALTRKKAEDLLDKYFVPSK